MSMLKYRLIIFLGFILPLSLAPAQVQGNEATMKLRLAQSFERAGEWEQAIPLYESLLFSDPRNFVYYDALRRGYVQLKEYDKAIELIRYRLTLEPANTLLASSLGSVYFQKGEERTADSIWQAIIRTNPTNAGLYRMIAGQMMEYRLYDRAISLFLQARQVIRDDFLFAAELANLYGAFQQYENAAREYVSLLIQQPRQVADIQSRMSLFLTRPEALPAVVKTIREAVAEKPELVALRQLYAWVLVEAKDHRAALDQYRIIDQRLKAGGVELFNFAQRTLAEGEWGIAGTAFHEVLAMPPPKELVPAVRIGLARALEELSVVADTLSPGQRVVDESWPVSEAPSHGNAVAILESVVRDYPRTPYEGQALFRIGVIRRDRLNDLDGALAAFSRVPTIMPDSPLAFEAGLAAAGVLVMKNNLAGARARYGDLLKLRPEGSRDRVLFHLAELDYFSADFDTSLAVLRQLVKNPSTDLANNALELMYFIEENAGLGSEALREFASGDLLYRQGRHAEALEQFRAVVRSYPDAYLADDATLRIAELQVLLRKPLDALGTLGNIVKDMPTSILRDRAQLRIAEIHERVLRNPAAAIQAYEELLRLFPASLHAEEARRRVRQLRGDAI